MLEVKFEPLSSNMHCLFFQGARIPAPIPQTVDVLNGVSNLDMRKFEPFLMEDVDQDGITCLKSSLSYVFYVKL